MNPEPDRAWSACRINLKPQIHKEFSSFDGFFAGYPLRPDDESEYYFNYSFYHTPDWCKVSGMTLKPVKSYKLSMEEVKKIAGDIFYNIKSFVTKMN